MKLDRRRRVAGAALLVISAAAAILASSRARSEDAKPQISYTAAQADHGAEVYSEKCAQCHGANLNDGQFAPALSGGHFKTDFGGKTAGDLYAYISANMPPGQGGELRPEDYADIEAFVLRANGAAPGPAAITPDPKTLGGTIPGS